MNLAAILSERAATYAERPALLLDGDQITFAELALRIEIAAASLRARGVRPGERVAIRLPNGTGFVAAFFGALRAGAIVVPLNILLADAEVDKRLAMAEPVVLVDEELPTTAKREADEIVPREPSDPAVILFTSGTSGSPKGAILTHGGIEAAAANAADALGLTTSDVVLGAAPFSHVLGQSSGLIATLFSGGAVAVVERFEPEATLRLMVETRTTILLGVPTMCVLLCEAARNATERPPIRIAHVGGAAVPVEVGRNFIATFGGTVCEGYGLTELSGIATTYRLDERPRDGSVGRPLGDTEMQIADPDDRGVGEVRFRGSSVIPGYWNDDEATSAAIDADGWLATGDVGRIDEDGFLYLVDRKKELIIRGGYNVYPREVEEVLYGHPDVLEAAVVGVADERLGEEVVALVVARAGTAPNPEALQEFTRERVAAYKYPRHVFVVDELPKGPTGKILKRAIDLTALLESRSPPLPDR